MEKIVLIGASGFVGSAILKEAIDREIEVTAVVRNPEKIKLESSLLTVVKADATNPKELADIVKGKDAIISAYNAGFKNPDIYNLTIFNYPKIIEGAILAGVKRILIVGGAGTLFIKPGVMVEETDAIPKDMLPAVKGLGDFYLDYLRKLKDIDWVFFSPAGNLGDMGTKGPGVRSGEYRLGKDDLIVDEKGNSFISVEDYAKAMIDELLEPQHHHERFTIGYWCYDDEHEKEVSDISLRPLFIQ